MFITKKRHEAEIEKAREEEADTIRDLKASLKKANADLAAARNSLTERDWALKVNAATISDQVKEIHRLRPLAQKHLDKLARDRKRVRGGAKVSAKSAVKKGAGK